MNDFEVQAKHPIKRTQERPVSHHGEIHDVTFQ